jgi:hypothetical protein
VKAVRRHMFPSTNGYLGMLEWLEENIQENFHNDRQKYNSSSVSQFVEWRSKDRESWVLRIAGNPPKTYVEILDEQKEIMFLLTWR